MSQIAVRHDHQDGQRHRKNHPDGKYEPSWFWFWCHVPLLAPDRCRYWRTLEGRIGEMCELLHTRTPCILSHYVFSCCLRGEQHEQSVTAAAAHRTRYGTALSRVFVGDLGLHGPA